FGVSFFFQAEDGIRAFHVTGVQTCALPICVNLGNAIHHLAQRDSTAVIPDGAGAVLGEGDIDLLARSHDELVYGIVHDFLEKDRSEERRVGKEGRGGWASLHKKEKDSAYVA